ncbi:MAG: hypothetical protein BroJett011_42620 [Chloroflexota bacterium]|nr:MAG: hypothetical protein BroJett011_42620 [Chloroflexota bacterium]
MTTGLTLQPLPLNKTPTPQLTPIFTDESNLPAAAKTQILNDWYKFLLNGCKQSYFTSLLYEFLCQHCWFPPGTGQDEFWFYYFHSLPDNFRVALNQFGGNNISVWGGNQLWLQEGIALDLKREMCSLASRVYYPLLHVIEVLWTAHNTILMTGYNYAPGLFNTPENPVMAPHFTVDDNVHNLMAYMATIAFQLPLPSAFQMMFPSNLVKPVVYATDK